MYTLPVLTFLILNCKYVTPNNTTADGDGGDSSLFVDDKSSFIIDEKSSDPYKGLCVTPECVQAAAEILNNMNKDVNPCYNFYGFACGNFVKKTIIPDDEVRVTLNDRIDNKVIEQLRMVIEDSSPENEAKPFRLAKDLYKACLNRTRVEEVGLTYINELIRRVGGWPVVEGDKWDESAFTWKDTVYKFKEEGFDVDYIIDFSIVTDSKNPTKRVIELDQAELSLAREILVKGDEEELVVALYSYMVDIAILFGADEARAETELKESLEFEISLANLCLPREERRDLDKLYNPMTIPELQEKYKSIPWFEYFSTIVPKTVEIKPDEVAIVVVPSYLEGLEQLLSSTPKRVQANYMLWRAVKSNVFALTYDLRRRQLKWGNALTGAKKRQPVWVECVSFTTGSLPFAIGSLYVKRFFKEDAKQSVLELVGNIREEMYKILQTVEWMDEDTRKNALEKAKAMVTHVGYREEILDIAKLEEFYQNLDLSPDNYLEDILNLIKFGRNYAFSQLRESVDRHDWKRHGDPSVVNAFYSMNENSIIFPAGILQGQFFSQHRPNYLNYGAIGMMIGRLITNGFDDIGRQYNKDGELVDWWDAGTKAAFIDKAACFIEQYNGYEEKKVGLKVNGVNTLGGNIADNGGVNQAYHAYIEWVKKNGEEQRLPGLHSFTPQQMFWLSAANIRCSKFRREVLKLLLTTGIHSPPEFRVVGPFSNRPEFAKDFKCSEDSQMNPEKKCQIW